jgi:hypothetical protein
VIAYYAVDIEGSHGDPRPPDNRPALRPPHSSIVSIGIVRVGNPDAHLYLELKPISGLWDPATEPIHLMTRAYLAAHGSDARAALERIAAWVRADAAGKHAIFCAMPLTYDWEYVDAYYRIFGIANPFVHAIDGRAQYRALMGLETHEKVEREKFHRRFPSVVPHLHHALGDALEYEEAVSAMLRKAGRI